jgi:hypothetical protein
MARFVNAQVPEVVQPFWAALQRGDAAVDAGRIASWAGAGGACGRAVVGTSRAGACRSPSVRRSRWRRRAIPSPEEAVAQTAC